MEDAKKMEREGFVIFHIGWFSIKSGYGVLHGQDLEQKHPDCSHALLSPGKRWSDTNAVAALILAEDTNGS